MRTIVKVLITLMLLVPTAALIAQETSYEVKNGTVVAVFNDQLVVKMANGQTREVTVPAGFKFTVDGKEVGLADLTPGTKLTAVIKTTKTPETVKTVKVKNGEVIRVTGNNLVVRTEGKNKSINVPAGFKFNVDGQQVGVAELRPGMKLTAEIVSTSVKTTELRDVKIGGNAPAPAPAPAPALAPTPVAAPAPAPEPAPAPAPAPVLPKTGSPLPLLGLLGVAMTAAGFALRRA